MATYTSDDLANIRKCIATGVLRTRYADGREVQFQDLDQLLAAEKVIAAAIEMAATATSGIVRKKLASFRNGC